jgi:DNA-binding SARP family transcriptional activator
MTAHEAFAELAKTGGRRRGRSPAGGAVRLNLTRGFELAVDGRRVEVPRSAQRLLALLALLGRPALRSFVAATLWLDTPDERALANLRSALWRLRRPGAELVESSGERLALAPTVRVDLRELADWARRIEADEPAELDDDRLDQLLAADDLLPDGYDEWLAAEREQFRQLRVHALESCCVQLTAGGRFSRAIQLGLAAVSIESLRESAHRALIRVHLAEGNPVAAIRQYESYRQLLQAELGLEPSPLIRQLVSDSPVAAAPSWGGRGGPAALPLPG